MFGSDGRHREKAVIEFSDDDQEDSLSILWPKGEFIDEKSKEIAVRWVRSARTNLLKDASQPFRVRRKSRRPYLTQFR